MKLDSLKKSLQVEFNVDLTEERKLALSKIMKIIRASVDLRDMVMRDKASPNAALVTKAFVESLDGLEG